MEKEKNFKFKFIYIVVIIILGFPILVAPFSGSFFSAHLAAFQEPSEDWSQIGSWIDIGIILLTNGLLTIYFIPYTIGIVFTFEKRKVSWISFLPLFYILAIILLSIFGNMLVTALPGGIRHGFYWP